MDAQKRDLIIARKQYCEASGEPHCCAECGKELDSFLSDLCDPCERKIYKSMDCPYDGCSDPACPFGHDHDCL